MRASCAVAAVLAVLLTACGTPNNELTVGVSAALSSATPPTRGLVPPMTLPTVTVPRTGRETISAPTIVAPTTVAPATTVPATTVPVTTAPATTVPAATVPATEPAARVIAEPTALPVPAEIPADPRAKVQIVQVGSIEIPKLGLIKPMYDGVTLTVLDQGPGHWTGTAMPGQMGNVVVAGHRTSHDRPFRNIDQLIAGDEVIFTTPDGRFVYQVTSTEAVAPTAVEIIDQTTAFTATLFACHPVGSTKQRLVVHLELAA